jgi:hypothetical protein
MIVKVEAVTPTEDQWPVLKHGTKWSVYRPTVAAQQCAMVLGADGSKTPMKPEVLELTAIQMSVAVKDKNASPQTGWIFWGFTYNVQAIGNRPWGTRLGIALFRLGRNGVMTLNWRMPRLAGEAVARSL